MYDIGEPLVPGLCSFCVLRLKKRLADERMKARSTATFPSTPENSVRSCRDTPASSSPPLPHTPTSRSRICRPGAFAIALASYLNVLRIM